MRINPIAQKVNYASYAPVQHKKAEKEQTKNFTDLNLLNSNYNNVAINFRAMPVNGAKELVKQIPLEDRISCVLQTFKLGDLLLVGKNINECAKKMLSADNIGDNAIKRAFFIAEENLDGNLGFVKNSIGDTQVINLNDFNIPFTSGNQTEQLKPNESFYLIDGDKLDIKGKALQIKDKPNTDLSKFRKTFAKTFDYNKEVQEKLEQVNKKTLSKLVVKNHKGSSGVTFADVGGLDKLKEALKRDVIFPLRYPEAYENIETNHGAILYGPPGTGKTHIARALANEAGANFISLNGLELESKWAGEAEEDWRELFKDAKESQPSIIFLDEFDAVARKRGGSDEYGDKIVNQILTLMTDIDNEGDNVFVLAATNNFDALDKAITRAGRFGKHYKVDTPDLNGLRDIFKIHTKNKQIDENVDVEGMLKKLEGLKASGADVRFVVNEAHHHGFKRSGIYEKMENKTFKKSDTDNFKIIQEDFDNAMNDFLENKKASDRHPIGYGN